MSTSLPSRTYQTTEVWGSPAVDLTPSYGHVRSWLAELPAPVAVAYEAAARVRGDEGNRRLHQRWVKFIERRERHTVANVAIARELAGWCWSLAVFEDQ